MAHGSGSSDDPAGEHFVFPIGRVVNVLHIEVRMAGDNVDALVRGFLNLPEPLIKLAAGLIALRPIAHAVKMSDVAGQRGVHSHDDGLDIRIGFVALQEREKPVELGGIELVRTGVVE